jgi:hypothetical protein
MNRYQDREGSSPVADWVTAAVRRNPEGLLLLAAGCALLMRTGGSSRNVSTRQRTDEWRDSNNMSPRSYAGGMSETADGFSEAKENAARYVSDLTSRASETAGSYAASLSDAAADAGRSVSDHSGRMVEQVQASMGRLLREQPLTVA